ncbi:MAG: type I secretion system permease/ATPase [Desulfobacterales bacterium]|jgi:PrtD family type I secretion system ABC transporter|nr:type I secretion system permease/ATPase [Desulfobacterales bacterium]
MKRFIAKWKYYFIFTAVFSAFINVLMLTMPLHMLQMYDRVLASGSVPTLVLITAAALGALIIMGILEYLRSRLLVLAGVDIENTLSEAVLAGMVKDAAQMENKGFSQGLQDVRLLRNFLGGNSVFCLFDAPWTPFYLWVVFLFHFDLGLISTIGAVVIFTLALVNEKVSRKPLQDANQVAVSSGRQVGTFMQHAQLVRAMGMLNGITRHWKKYNKLVLALQTLASNRAGLIGALTKPVRMGLQVLILAYGAYLVVLHEVTPGVMIAASIITGRALQPVEMAIGTWKQMVDARGAYARLKLLIDTELAAPAQMELPVPTGRLTAENVVFAVAGKPILKGIFLDLAPGDALGLVGASGAGKSTLARLMLGIWRPYAGSVRLDGADIFTWNQEHLGRFIGYVPQEVALFPGTIADNIARMGEVDAEKVIAAARMANVHDMILKFPDGYDTVVGENTYMLSGGQRQRIALARALYDDPRLVVMDEPNSNLDEEGERALMMALVELKKKGATTVLISHKLSLLSRVDKLLVLKDGQLLMYGPRNEVLQKLTPPPPPQAAPVAPPPIIVRTGMA